MIVMTDKKRISIGLVGAGFMAKSHSNAYHTIPYIYNNSSYEIVRECISATTEQKANAAKQRYIYNNYCVGYEGVTNNPNVDVVDICTSDVSHKEIALSAIKNNKHVICEKPLALSAQDALEMKNAARATNIKALCGYNYRFVSAIMLAKKLIESGKMGRVYHFYGDYSQDVGAFEDTPLEKLWYAHGPKSSGVANGIGTHVIDLSRFLVGEIVQTCGMVSTYNKTRSSETGTVNIEQDEEVNALFKFASGATGTIRASAMSAGRKNSLRFEISCTKGSIVFDLENLNSLLVCQKDTVTSEIAGFTNVNVTQIDRDHPFMDVWWPRGHGVGWEHAHINMIAHFLKCVANNEDISPYGATFEDGYKVCKIIEAIKQSSKLQKFIDIIYE